MGRASSAKQLFEAASAAGQRRLALSVCVESQEQCRKRARVCSDKAVQCHINLPQAAPASAVNTASADGYLHDFLELWLDGVVEKVIGDLDNSVVMEFRKKSRKKHLQTKLVTNKRRSYDAHEKEAILSLCNESKCKSEVVKEVRVLTGNKHFNLSSLKRFKKEHTTTIVDVHVPKKNKKRGRIVNSEFEVAVLGCLVYSVLEKVEDRNRARVEANVAYSYAVIEKAAKLVQKDVRFKNDPSVSKLKFSNKWIKGFLRRNAFYRRTTTAIAKERPPLHEIRAIMTDIQETIEKNKFSPAQCFSSDETAMFYASPPKNQFVPEDAARGCAPAGDEKARFTTLESGDADGGMLPSMHVIKCTVKKGASDFSQTRVIHKLHRETGFTESDGWKLGTWEKTMTLQKKVQGVTESFDVTFKRPYIQHTTKQHLVTCQGRAWMDVAGVAMWAELLLGPWVRDKCGGQGLLIWDNCTCHNVSALQAVFDSFNVTVKNLPKNMTDVLQVMDLVVNAPLKAGIRRMRCDQLFDHFQVWKFKRVQEAAKAADVRKLPPWAPPKVSVADGIRTVIKVEETELATPDFRQSMSRCFVSVGLKKDPVTDKYVTYSHKKSGTISSLHYDVENLAVTEVIHTGSFCLGDEAMQLENEEEDVE